MGLYLLVEKRLGSKRLGNVGLNVDENIRNTDEKRRLASHGPKGLRPASARCGCSFFNKIRPKKMKRLAGPAPCRREETLK